MEMLEKVLSIRKMQIEDAEPIAHIYSLITQTAFSENFEKMVENYVLEEAHEPHFVAELGGEVVGFMISYLLPLGFGAEKSAYIATMGIHPKYMGKSIGAGMTNEIFKFYKSQAITRVYTSVRWDSTDLLSFCKTMGFGRSNFVNLVKDI